MNKDETEALASNGLQRPLLRCLPTPGVRQDWWWRVRETQEQTNRQRAISRQLPWERNQASNAQSVSAVSAVPPPHLPPPVATSAYPSAAPPSTAAPSASPPTTERCPPLRSPREASANSTRLYRASLQSSRRSPAPRCCWPQAVTGLLSRG